MIPPSETHPPPPGVSQSSSDSRESSIRRYTARCQLLLWSLVAVALLLMVLGILFVAHQYFVDFGGQGWLKVREVDREQLDGYGNNVFLPLRQREVWSVDNDRWKRSPQNNVPFYECGDQENSCESYNEPNICCPPWAICYKSSDTTSGVLCCNASWSAFECQSSEKNPPKCLASLIACSPETGGGCCPKDDICSPNGCIHASTATILSVSNISVATAVASSPSGSNAVGSPITITNTVTEVPAATSTVVKEGKIAQQEGTGSKGSVTSTLFVPYSSVWLLLFIGVLMGML